MLSRHLLRKLLLATASAAAALLSAPTASADSLGVAADYNVFVLGNMSQSNADAQGKVAVQGDATFNNYTVGSSLPSSSTTLSPTFTPAVPLPASAPAGAAFLSLLALKRRRENAP